MHRGSRGNNYYIDRVDKEIAEDALGDEGL